MISLTSPVRTGAHGWPAGLKLLALCAVTIILFFVQNPHLHLAVTATVVLAYRLPGRVFFQAGVSRLIILWPFVVIVVLWHLLTGDARGGATIVLRMVSVVALANLVTMTTPLTDMTDLIERILAPLQVRGLRTDAIALAIALVIRATPTLIEKGRHLTDAWGTRTHRRLSPRIIAPFILLAIDDADHIAEALRARGALRNRQD